MTVYQARDCSCCGNEFVPDAPARRHCSYCSRNLRRREPGWSICAGRNCHNLMPWRSRRSKYCSPECHPHRPGSHPESGVVGAIVVDRSVRGVSLEAIARRRKVALARVIEILREHRIDPEATPAENWVPSRLLKRLAETELHA